MNTLDIESEAIKKELNDMKIEELIDKLNVRASRTAEYIINSQGRSGMQISLKDEEDELLIYQIALATLRLHKAGNVMVPSEPTDEMVSTMEEMYMPMGEMVAAYDGAVIIARPRTELDALLGGLK